MSDNNQNNENNVVLAILRSDLFRTFIIGVMFAISTTWAFANQKSSLETNLVEIKSEIKLNNTIIEGKMQRIEDKFNYIDSEFVKKKDLKKLIKEGN